MAPAPENKFVDAPELLSVSTPIPKIEGGLVLKGPVIDPCKTKLDGFDVQAEINKMADSAKTDDSLRLGEILPDDTLLTAGGLIDVDFALLQEAKAHIQKKEYLPASQKLDAYLAKKKGHPEALYLKALCILYTDKPIGTLNNQISALRILSSIDPARTGKPLDDLIAALKTRACGQVYLKFPILMMISANILFTQLTELMQLDPQRAEYYAFKAIVLRGQRNVPAAYECVLEGIRIAGDRVPPILTGLKNDLESQLLYLALQPAIQHFKKEEFGKSLKALGKADDRFKGTVEYTLFDAYLRQFSAGGLLGRLGGSKKIADVKMGGSLDERKKLQSLIVRDEILVAQQHMNRGNFAGAEQVLMSALQVTPDYVFLCFLLAACRFRQFNDAFQKQRLPDIDTILSELEKTRQFAKLATADADQPVPAQLLAQVEQAIGFFTGLRSAILKRQEEIGRVNAIIKEFVSIMERAKKGIDSPQVLEELFKRMKEVKKQVTQAKPKMALDESKKTLLQLDQAVDRNLKALQSLSKVIEDQKKDVVVINGATERFKSIMERAKGGIDSESKLEGITEDLRKLKRDIPAMNRKLITDGARKNLDQLEQAVDRNLGQVEQMSTTFRSQFKDKAVVDEHGKEFLSIMAVLKSGSKFTSRYELQRFRDRVSAAQSEAKKARSTVTTAGAKEALGQMINQYDGLLQQINGVL
ncbi:hypothetical protein JW777_10690 [bacterium]|nr:hypothetical protein [bacterium]